jgi:hypothetical protein
MRMKKVRAMIEMTTESFRSPPKQVICIDHVLETGMKQTCSGPLICRYFLFLWRSNEQPPPPPPSCDDDLA